ncbi:hypothetical protein I553_3508 [Mycobacterium xenopi 4042]|uniref:Uncharacterized protein n=1 Tax=Mycobacterium xenopi 4042 TaxID=1299334 RepID=X7ZZF7_MYCXE|nr:hypothetical protein I553_3508 [Mycobacterium xenopi 4042]
MLAGLDDVLVRDVLRIVGVEPFLAAAVGGTGVVVARARHGFRLDGHRDRLTGGDPRLTSLAFLQRVDDQQHHAQHAGSDAHPRHQRVAGDDRENQCGKAYHRKHQRDNQHRSSSSRRGGDCYACQRATAAMQARPLR